MFLGKVKKIHMIGIGGIGMSGIAELLVNLGIDVSGSDLKKTESTKRLEALGCRIHYRHRREHIRDQDVVVISSAIKEDNPEVQEAKERGIPVIPRAEMLFELMRMKYSIAVAGAHGKTTTTSMIAEILTESGLDPTLVLGGRLKASNKNAFLGSGNFVVCEADESDGSFLKLLPTICVVTNIDDEHMDFYGSRESLKRHFVDFVNKVPFYGLAVLCMDDPGVTSIISSIKRRYVTYGFSPQADYHIQKMDQTKEKTCFTIKLPQERVLDVELPIPGKHNVLNATASIAVADEVGINLEIIKKSLSAFSGVRRRFEIVYDGSVRIIDDYAHHPAEIEAVLKTARQIYDGRIVAVFQPHRYSRLKDHFDEFLGVLSKADVVVVTEVYSAGEEPIGDWNGAKLFRRLKESGFRYIFFGEKRDRVVETVINNLMKGDTIITLGAGDVTEIARMLKERLCSS